LLARAIKLCRHPFERRAEQPARDAAKRSLAAFHDPEVLVSPPVVLLVSGNGQARTPIDLVDDEVQSYVFAPVLEPDAVGRDVFRSDSEPGTLLQPVSSEDKMSRWLDAVVLLADGTAPLTLDAWGFVPVLDETGLVGDADGAGPGVLGPDDRLELTHNANLAR
jgi:hypothetical protein